MSCVTVEPGGAVPLISIWAVWTVEPSAGEVIESPTLGDPVGVGLGDAGGVGGSFDDAEEVGVGAIGGKVGVGVVVGVGGMVGEGVGGRVGMGVGVGGRVGEGLGVGVGGGIGVGVSWTKIGSVEMAVAVGDADGLLAMSGDRPPKTLATMISVITVTPATNPASSQSRRGGAAIGRRDLAPWATPLWRWPAGRGG